MCIVQNQEEIKELKGYVNIGNISSQCWGAVVGVVATACSYLLSCSY